MKNTRKCKVCKERFTPTFHTMQPTCLKPECLAEHGRSEYKKQREKEEKKRKKPVIIDPELEVLKEKVKNDRENTYRWLSGKLEEDIRELIRLIDYGQLCISCQKPPKKRNAGHYWSAGGYPNLRYHLENIWLQCEKCNSSDSGNLPSYLANINAIYGKEYSERLQYDLRRLYPTVKLSVPEMKEKRVIVKRLIKYVQEHVKTRLTASERLKMRQYCEEQIGIYAIEKAATFDDLSFSNYTTNNIRHINRICSLFFSFVHV